MFDLHVRHAGNIFLLAPESQTGRDWLSEHAPDDAQWFGRCLVVEHRYVQDWALQALEAGLRVH
jgi:hypothetical protein